MMMSLIDRLPEKFKKVAFLILMLFFCYLLVLSAETFGPNENARSLYVEQATAFDEEKIELISQSRIQEVEPQQMTIEGFDYVMGVDTGVGPGNQGGGGCTEESPTACYSEPIPFQPVCGVTGVDINLNDGTEAGGGGDSVVVEKNSIIEIWKVTSPLGLLSGVEEMSDNTLALKKDRPNYRASSDLINKEYVATQSLAPESEVFEMVDETIPDLLYPYGKDFSVNAAIAGLPGADQHTVDSDEIATHTDPEGNGLDANPNRTNRNSEEITDVFRVPGDPIQPRTYGFPGCIELERITHMPNQDVFETCSNSRKPYDLFVSAIVNAAQWAQCLIDEAQCTEMEIVGILIDAIYGSNWTCNDDYCGIQFFDHGMAVNLAPPDYPDYVEAGFHDEPEPVMKARYVSTPCKIRIDYARIYDIPCIWDVSPYMNLYYTEAQMRYPDDPEMPTWDEYWSATIAEAERRGQACGF